MPVNNLLVRTISGIGFIGIMLCCLLVSEFLFAGLVMFIMAVMMHEFYGITMGDSFKPQRIFAIAAGIIQFLLVFCCCAFGLSSGYVSVSVVLFIALMCSTLWGDGHKDFAKSAYLYAGLLYVAAPLCLSNLLAFSDGCFNARLLLCFFVLIWCSDIGAFSIGCAFGQKPDSRKLWPEISPKKSWWGFWGGMAAAVASSLALHHFGILPIPVWHCVILSVIVHVSAVLGDLFESKWKRTFGVKDSGSIIPGHGGMLDRFDSTLTAVPVGAIYLSLFGLL